MKKYIFLLSIVLMAAACMRGDYMSEPDIVGGRIQTNNQEGRKYMMYIADNLVTDVLDELELALSISERGIANSAHFSIDRALTKVGSTWKVKADDSQLYGMTLRCTAEDTWQMEFEGDYVFGSEENQYPTQLSLTAVRYVPAEEESIAQGWVVTLSGERREWNDDQKNRGSKSDYHCIFGTRTIGKTIQYINTRGNGAKGWDQMFGDLYMTVYKADETVDVCCLSFEGSPSRATFLRGI
jgi:hypothetical protein